MSGQGNFPGTSGQGPPSPPGCVTLRLGEMTALSDPVKKAELDEFKAWIEAAQKKYKKDEARCQTDEAKAKQKLQSAEQKILLAQNQIGAAKKMMDDAEKMMNEGSKMKKLAWAEKLSAEEQIHVAQADIQSAKMTRDSEIRDVQDRQFLWATNTI